MNPEISNTELTALLKILDKELVKIEKEIHRTDALTFKHELQEEEKLLNELRNKLKLIEA